MAATRHDTPNDRATNGPDPETTPEAGRRAMLRVARGAIRSAVRTLWRLRHETPDAVAALGDHTLSLRATPRGHTLRIDGPDGPAETGDGGDARTIRHRMELEIDAAALDRAAVAVEYAITHPTHHDVEPPGRPRLTR